MATLDFDNVKHAMNQLAETPDGNRALSEFSDAIDKLGQSIPSPLNPVELRYVAERLIAQRHVTGEEPTLKEAAAARVLPHGFIIKTAPQ